MWPERSASRSRRSGQQSRQNGGGSKIVGMRDYKNKGETFKLDDSNSYYVEVTYKNLTGYIGVNIGRDRGPERPYIWHTNKLYVTPAGLTAGNSSGISFEDNLKHLCVNLVSTFRTEESAKAFDAEKSCENLHDAVNNLPLGM